MANTSNSDATPNCHAATLSIQATARTAARIGIIPEVKLALAFPQSASRPGRTPKARSSPVVERFSRNLTRGLRSIAAAWRARTSSGGAGASSHRASVSSPARVRAVHSNSKSEALPKRSRSRAQGSDASRKRSPVAPLSRPGAVKPRQPLLIKPDSAGARSHGAQQIAHAGQQ